jgi:hypothetical protein
MDGVNARARADGASGQPPNRAGLRAVRVNKVKLSATKLRAELAKRLHVNPGVDASPLCEMRDGHDGEPGLLGRVGVRAALRGEDGRRVPVRVESERATQRDAARSRSEFRHDLGNAYGPCPSSHPCA